MYLVWKLRDVPLKHSNWVMLRCPKYIPSFKFGVIKSLCQWTLEKLVFAYLFVAYTCKLSMQHNLFFLFLTLQCYMMNQGLPTYWRASCKRYCTAHSCHCGIRKRYFTCYVALNSIQTGTSLMQSPAEEH